MTPATLRIACRQPLTYAPQLVAEEIGAYRRAGLEVSFVEAGLGYSATDALRAGDADLMIGNGMYAHLGRETPRALRPVADLALRSYLVLAARREVPGVRGETLGDRLVLVPGTTPAFWVAIRSVLEAAGVPRAAMRILPCLSVDDAVALHDGGLGDLLLLPLEVALRAGLREIMPLAEILGPVPWSVYYVLERRAADLRDEIERFTAALGEGLAWCAAHTATEIGSLLAPGVPAAEAPLRERVLERYAALRIWAAEPGPSLDAAERWRGLLRAQGLA